MAITYTDLIEGNTGKKSIDGWELTRIAIVTGVTGTGHSKIINAAQELPAILSSHPALSTCLLHEIIPESISSDSVKFRLVYSEPTPARFQPQLDTIEIGGTLSQVQTNKDINDVQMFVEHTWPATDEDWPNKHEVQSDLVTKLAPEHSVTYSKLLSYNPQGLAQEFVGTINSGPWLLVPYAVEQTWLCTGIVGRSNDGGITYVVTYTFQYRVDTWKKMVYFKDTRTGRPAKDLEPGEGIKGYDVYPVKDFNLIFS